MGLAGALAGQAGPRLGGGDPTEAASVDVDPEYTRPHVPCRGHGVGPVGVGVRAGPGGAMIFPFSGTNYVNCARKRLAQFLLALEKALEEGTGAKSLSWSGVVFFFRISRFLSLTMRMGFGMLVFDR